MQYQQQTSQLAVIAKQIYQQHFDYLCTLKQTYVDLQRHDFLWHYLLQSFATMGRSAGYEGLIADRQNYDQITFAALTALSADARETVVKQVCCKAKIRMPNRKATFILGCFDSINSMGGLQAATQKLLQTSGCGGKIKFLRQLPGIGPKYARNIMMDVYHEDFRQSIAIDVRISAISKALDLQFHNYHHHEAFYLAAAAAAGLNGWELDRLMYHFQPEFLKAIAKSKA